MTGVYTDPSLHRRVELAVGDDKVSLTLDAGHHWDRLGADEARALAAGLCVAAQKVDLKAAA